MKDKLEGITATQDDLYYLNQIGMNANKEKQVSNLVTEFVKNIKNKYKYICDTFLEPAYDDYNKYTKDEINKKNISLKLYDSIIYFLSKITKTYQTWNRTTL